jgi:hypothetical protein
MEVPMSHSIRVTITQKTAQAIRRWMRFSATIATVCLLLPIAAHAQSGSPVAKVASLIAIVIGGYGFAHGEPGAKKALAGVAAGTGIAVLAVNVLSWLWGV